MTTNSLLGPRKIGIFLGVQRLTGGMFQYAQAVLEALASLDPKRYVVVIAYSDAAWAPILKRFCLSGHVMRHPLIGQRIADVAMLLQLPPVANRVFGRCINPLVHELKSLHCDAWIFPAGETLTYQMSGRMIGVIHDLMHRYEPSFPEVSALFRYRLREHRMGNIARYCEAVLVDSAVGRQHVVESYGVAAEKVIPIPYIAPSYLRDTTERADFDTHYQLPSKFLFYPAQFWPHKNHFRLIDAIHRVSIETCPDIQIVLSGAKRYMYEEVKRHAEKRGISDRIHFVGYVQDADLRGFYVRARALVMPTFFGPTNIPPLEALATGCPAVVSGIYGMIEQSGDAALYFDPNSETEMAERITQVWRDDDLASQLKAKGLERSQRYGQAEFGQRLLGVIDSVFKINN
jgi:glycosyltransferase involved in cell wall biosynthesis